ncbi:MAG: hypothetical protein H6865_07760 [Rhodospirillales bacterium]|nr:hypothetical protein [Alphaproteobacteria bacterium]MCB9987510.1 hypothetical protein [Rhodospirillales bacterium]USO07516.1 MAG: hypothetical protein H6866_08895 [Rhodospirillales bacterium]
MISKKGNTGKGGFAFHEDTRNSGKIDAIVEQSGAARRYDQKFVKRCMAVPSFIPQKTGSDEKRSIYFRQ